MMTKYDKERFNKRISDEVQISADIRINDFMTESATYVIITESSLYERICQYALQHGEDLQGMFKDERYEYMSCFVRDVAAFRANFESEEMLKPLLIMVKVTLLNLLSVFLKKESRITGVQNL